MLEVAVVDDSTSDAKLIMMMAKRLKIANPFRHFESGPAVLDYLASGAALPGLILL
ncbi:MAG: response regulator, partial [Actinobacteria bacterium]|nr:response regulator [Actinomycetota bacterium]